jgi:hypothetical protein
MELKCEELAHVRFHGDVDNIGQCNDMDSSAIDVAVVVMVMAMETLCNVCEPFDKPPIVLFFSNVEVKMASDRHHTHNIFMIGMQLAHT